MFETISITFIIIVLVWFVGALIYAVFFWKPYYPEKDPYPDMDELEEYYHIEAIRKARGEDVS